MKVPADSITTFEQGPVVSRDRKHVVQNYGRYPLVVRRAEGVYLHGNDGRRYLDFLSGIGVMALGHSHPQIMEAIAQQSRTLMHCSNLYFHAGQGEVGQRLAAVSGLPRAFFCNSGSEAVEAALKIAKGHGRAKDPEKHRIVALDNSFGGRTLGAISVTGQPKYAEPFAPLIPGIRFVAPNDLAALEQAVDEHTAAIIFEPILGEGGIVEIRQDFAERARGLADEHGALLVLDEIQCGLGRTGQTFAFEAWETVQPDVITLAKPLAAGLPMGAVLCTEAAAAVLAPGMHGSTFGGGALACRTATEFLDMLPQLLPHVRDIGEYFQGRLQAIIDRGEFATAIRGRGLMLGLELNVPGGEFVTRAQELGLLINCTAGNILRFLPPYIIEREHVDLAIACLEQVFRMGPPASD